MKHNTQVTTLPQTHNTQITKNHTPNKRTKAKASAVMPVTPTSTCFSTRNNFWRRRPSCVIDVMWGWMVLCREMGDGVIYTYTHTYISPPQTILLSRTCNLCDSSALRPTSTTPSAAFTPTKGRPWLTA